MRLSLFLIFLLLVSTSAKAQFNLGFDHYNDIKVIEDEDTLRFPWAGGMNVPQFSSLDANLDGIPDIYAYERDGAVTRMFLNDGSGHFTADMHSYRKLPYIGWSFALMRDFNGDGKQDVFCSDYNNNGLAIYKNVSDSTLAFEEVMRVARYSRIGMSYLNFNIPTNDLPAIQDFDGDGDLDVLIQMKGGTHPMFLHLIESRSMEEFGSLDSLKFRLKNECWGGIRESPISTGWIYGDCDTSFIQQGNGGGERHGVTTTLTTADLNGDGLLDLLTGDTRSPHITAMFNQSHNVYADIDTNLNDTTFPSYDTPCYLPVVPASYMEDIDLDGLKDMLLAPNQLSKGGLSVDTSLHRDMDWYYRNTGSASNPNYELQKKGFFTSEMIDVGARSFPAIVDLNGDGLLDLVVGNEGYTIYGGTSPAKLALYLNVGDEEHPVFSLVNEDLASVSDQGLGYAHPTFADLDDDGDFDMIIGDQSGRIHYYKNKGVAAVHDFHLVETNFAGIDVDESAHPFFFDLNQDNIEDLIIGDRYGQIHYYENAGTETEHDFSKNPTIYKMGNVQTFSAFGGEATPYVTRKLDSLGASLYILMGSAKGAILVLGPITNIYDPLSINDSIVVDATYTAPVGADFFGDFRHELIIGQRTGGLFAMRRIVEIGVGSAASIQPRTYMQIYPNPSQGTLTLHLPSNHSAQVHITNLAGQMVFTQLLAQGNDTYQLNLQPLAPGMYTVRVNQGDQTFFASWIKQ
jgi:hypothetical protein